MPKGSSNANAATASAAPSVSQSVGFMPKRNEFDQEYDHEAEDLLADMEFTELDLPQDI